MGKMTSHWSLHGGSRVARECIGMCSCNQGSVTSPCGMVLLIVLWSYSHIPQRTLHSTANWDISSFSTFTSWAKVDLSFCTRLVKGAAVGVSLSAFTSYRLHLLTNSRDGNGAFFRNDFLQILLKISCRWCTACRHVRKVWRSVCTCNATWLAEVHVWRHYSGNFSITWRLC